MNFLRQGMFRRNAELCGICTCVIKSCMRGMCAISVIMNNVCVGTLIEA